MTSSRARRAGALVASVSTLALVGGTVGAAPASADPSPSSEAAAAWLVDEISGGLFQYPSFPATDHGLNIDAALAMLDAGDTAAAQAVADELEPEIGDYINGEAFGDEGSAYGNPTAKILYLLTRLGVNASDYGGYDLPTILAEQTYTEGAATGRIFDTSIYGDNANALGQAFAAAATGDAATVDYLLLQQCPGGDFRLELGDPEASAAEQGCTTASTEPSTDVTALVVGLIRPLSDDADVASAIDAAATFLASQQAEDGSFGGVAPTTAPNANSTGLAAWALGSACEYGRATAAADWVRDIQLSNGAVAYDQAAYAEASDSGIAENDRDQFRRATSQAALGLSYDGTATSGLTILRTGGGGYLKGGTNIVVGVSGVQATGQQPCLFVGGASTILVAQDGVARTGVTLPRRTTNLRLLATSGPGGAGITAKVLGPKKLRNINRTKRVERRGAQVVTVRGLEARESVRLKYRKPGGGFRTVKTGKASRKGIVRARFKVGNKVGLGTVRVVGEYGFRSGTKKFRVVS